MFCQLEVLRHCFPSSVRQILEELPESLDETYERILKEIRKPKQGHAHRLLQCLVAAVRSLRVEELAEVLAFDFKAEGDPETKPRLAVEESRRSSDVGLLKFGHHSQGWGFTDRPVFAFLGQGILDREPTCGAHQRCLAVSHTTRGSAYDSCTSVPWRPPPIGRSH